MTKTVSQSTRREAAVARLETREWWNNTKKSVKDKLLALPEDTVVNDNAVVGWDGFLEDLANRDEVVGGNTQVRIRKVRLANYGVIVIFDVIAPNGNSNQYEYFSWRYGIASGAKGIVLVRTGRRITHFFVLRGEKFATGNKLVWDTVGGFADLGATGVDRLDKRVLIEIRQELGAEHIELREYYDLGTILTDPGMTNNNPGVYAAVIDAKGAHQVTEEPVNPDWKELPAKAYLLPIEQLGSHLAENGDPFLTTAAMRAVGKRIIPARHLVALAA